MGDRCTCQPPCLVPCSAHHRAGEMPQGRDWLICVACGIWHQEADPAVVERVHAENEAWEASEDAADALRLATPKCLRPYRPEPHRYIALRSGARVCRDCGTKEAS